MDSAQCMCRSSRSSPGTKWRTSGLRPTTPDIHRWKAHLTVSAPRCHQALACSPVHHDLSIAGSISPQLSVQGPTKTPYEGGTFELDIKVPDLVSAGPAHRLLPDQDLPSQCPLQGRSIWLLTSPGDAPLDSGFGIQWSSALLLAPLEWYDCFG